MRLVIYEHRSELSANAALEIARQLQRKPNSVLGLPTGETPVSVYKNLVEKHKRGEIDFSEVVTFNLDEYIGIPKSHRESYHSFMHRNLFNHVNVKPTNVNIPDGQACDLEAECESYENRISAAGGIDLLVLGIGHNGHIGFNEPGTPFDTKTHVVDLALSTIRANSRFFADEKEVPVRAITMGIKTILSAKSIMLMAAGHEKAQIIHEAFTKPATPAIPASALQFHDSVLLMLDKNAGRYFNKQ